MRRVGVLVGLVLSVLLSPTCFAQQDWRTPRAAPGEGASHSVQIGRDCEYPGSATGEYTVSMPVGNGEWVFLTRAQHAYKMANPGVGYNELCKRSPGPAFQLATGSTIGTPVDLDRLLANPRPMSTPPVSVQTPAYPANSPASRPAAAQNAPALNQQLDRVISQDARSWLVNRYTVGSARDAVIEDYDPATQRMVVFARYTYNSASTGWIRVVFKGETPQCVEYHDFRGTCRAIWNNPSHYVALGGLAIALAGAASAGSGSGSSDAGGYDDCVARCNSGGYSNDPGRDAAFRQNCIRQCR